MEIDEQITFWIVGIGYLFGWIFFLLLLVSKPLNSITVGLAVVSFILALCFMGTILVMEIIQHIQKKKMVRIRKEGNSPI